MHSTRLCGELTVCLVPRAENTAVSTRQNSCSRGCLSSSTLQASVCPGLGTVSAGDGVHTAGTRHCCHGQSLSRPPSGLCMLRLREREASCAKARRPLPCTLGREPRPCGEFAPAAVSPWPEDPLSRSEPRIWAGRPRVQTVRRALLQLKEWFGMRVQACPSQQPVT